MKRLLFSFVALLCAMISNAQIGYQVSLLNTATGEPRANETVTCQIELTNSEGAVICSETKSATSNDFGVISLSVGNASTFEQMDWSKLPLYVSVSIGGKLVGQSQVLTVPVAEHAKHYGVLTYEGIEGKEVVTNSSSYEFTFTSDRKVIRKENNRYQEEGKYFIEGNTIFFYIEGFDSDCHCTYYHHYIGFYSIENDKIYIIP